MGVLKQYIGAWIKLVNTSEYIESTAVLTSDSWIIMKVNKLSFNV